MTRFSVFEGAVGAACVEDQAERMVRSLISRDSAELTIHETACRTRSMKPGT